MSSFLSISSYLIPILILAAAFIGIRQAFKDTVLQIPDPNGAEDETLTIPVPKGTEVRYSCRSFGLSDPHISFLHQVIVDFIGIRE